MKASGSPQSPRLHTVSTSFEEIFDAHAGFVWRVLRYCGVAERDLPDIAQEVFLVIHRRVESHDPARSSLRTWIFGIAQNTARNHRRLARHGREVGMDALPDEIDPSQGPEDVLVRSRARAQLVAALESLSAEQRTVVVLHDLEEVPMQDIAALESIPVATAYSRLRLGRARLNALLESGEGPPP